MHIFGLYYCTISILFAQLLVYDDHTHFDFIIRLLCNSIKTIELANNQIGITVCRGVKSLMLSDAWEVAYSYQYK